MLNAFVDLGSIVVLPILIFIFGLILGTKPGKAFTSALTVGVGFVGLNLVIDLLSNSLGPAAQQMVERFGLNLTTIDVGWPAAAAISYGTILGSLAIPIGVVLNVVLIIFWPDENIECRYLEYLACGVHFFVGLCFDWQLCHGDRCNRHLSNDDSFDGRYFRTDH